MAVGFAEGFIVGPDVVGATVGLEPDGPLVGIRVGIEVVGAAVGSTVGAAVGALVG